MFMDGDAEKHLQSKIDEQHDDETPSFDETRSIKSIIVIQNKKFPAAVLYNKLIWNSGFFYFGALKQTS